jgi:hypothetical protein
VNERREGKLRWVKVGYVCRTCLVCKPTLDEFMAEFLAESQEQAPADWPTEQPEQEQDQQADTRLRRPRRSRRVVADLDSSS